MVAVHRVRSRSSDAHARVVVLRARDGTLNGISTGKRRPRFVGGKPAYARPQHMPTQKPGGHRRVPDGFLNTGTGLRAPGFITPEKVRHEPTSSPLSPSLRVESTELSCVRPLHELIASLFYCLCADTAAIVFVPTWILCAAVSFKYRRGLPKDSCNLLKDLSLFCALRLFKSCSKPNPLSHSLETRGKSKPTAALPPTLL